MFFQDYAWLQRILMFLDIPSLLQLCLVNRDGPKSVNSNVFVMNRIKLHTFGFPGLVELLGGKQVFCALPAIYISQRCGHTDYIDFLSCKDLEGSIAIGIDRWRRRFVAFMMVYEITNKEDNETLWVTTIFQRYTDCGFYNYGGSSRHSAELTLGVHAFTLDGKTLKVKERLRNLAAGKSVMSIR